MAMMSDRIRIEWTFSPPDFFEDRWLIACDGVEIDIQEGRVTATLDGGQYDSDEGVLDRLDHYIGGLFEGWQLENHTGFSLSPGVRQPKHFDRCRHVTVSDDGHGAEAVDIKGIDRQGSVVKDTRAERIDRQRQFAKAVAERKGLDAVLDAMLASYSKAVDHPDHELLHLYEVRDALATKFGGENEACRILSVHSAKWERLGRLANGPLREGRHGGRHLLSLRSATSAELAEAGAIAKQMIVAYMDYLRKCRSGISMVST